MEQEELGDMLSRRAVTRCGSNCSTFNNLHQAAGYRKELQFKAGDFLTVVIIWCRWCSVKSELSFCLQTGIVQFYHKWQTHPRTYIFKNSLALDANQEKVWGGKYSFILLFHSHIQHSCLLGNEGQQSWAWETVCLFSVLHAREQVNTLNLDERRRKEGSAAFCLSLCWTTEKSSWCRSVPGLSMWPIHPSSRAVQMFVPKHLLPHRMYFFRVCVQCYEEFSSDRN